MASRIILSNFKTIMTPPNIGMVHGTTGRCARLALKHFTATARLQSTTTPKFPKTILQGFKPGSAQRDLEESRAVLAKFMLLVKGEEKPPKLEAAEKLERSGAPVTELDPVVQESWAGGEAHHGHYIGTKDVEETLAILKLLEPTLDQNNLFIEQLGGATGMLCVGALQRSAELALTREGSDRPPSVIGATVHGAVSIDVSRSATRIGNYYISRNPYLRNRIKVLEGNALSTPVLTGHMGPSLLIANRMITVLNISQSAHLVQTVRGAMKHGDHIFLSYLLTEGKEFSDTISKALVPASGLSQMTLLKMDGISTVNELHTSLRKTFPQFVKEDKAVHLRLKEAFLESHENTCRIGFTLGDSTTYADVTLEEGEGILDGIQRKSKDLLKLFAEELDEGLFKNEDVKSLESQLESLGYSAEEAESGSKYVISQRSTITLSKDKREVSVQFPVGKGYRFVTFRDKDYCRGLEGFEVQSTDRSKDLQLALLKRV